MVQRTRGTLGLRAGSQQRTPGRWYAHTRPETWDGAWSHSHSGSSTLDTEQQGSWVCERDCQGAVYSRP